MSYKRSYFTPEQVQNEQQDLIIQQLRSDIFQLKKNEQDNLILMEELRKMEYKYKLTQEENFITNSENKQRNDSNYRQTNNYQQELESLKLDIREKNRNIKQMHDENVNLKEICDNRYVEIQRIKQDLSETFGRGQQYEDQMIDYENHIGQMRNDKKILIKSTADMNQNIEEIKARNNELEKIMFELETQRNRIQKQTLQFQSENEQLEKQILRIVSDFKNFDQKGIEQERNLRQLQLDIKSVDNQNEKLQMESKNFNQNYQKESQSNQELKNRILNLEAIQKSKERQISDIEKDINEINADNEAINEGNQVMQADLENCKKHIEQLNIQNSELVKQLEMYSDLDEQIRQLLNRKEIVKDLRFRTESGKQFSKVSPLKQNKSQRDLGKSGKSTQEGFSRSPNNQMNQSQVSKRKPQY